MVGPLLCEKFALGMYRISFEDTESQNGLG